jgi:hypothetical protein
VAGAETTRVETTHGRWHRVWLCSEVPAAVDAWESAQAGEFAGAFGDAGGGGREGTECDSVVELRGPSSSEVRLLEGGLRRLEKLPCGSADGGLGLRRCRADAAGEGVGLFGGDRGERDLAGAQLAAAGVSARVEEVRSGAVSCGGVVWGAATEAGVVVGGGAEEDSMGGGVVVQPVHASGERLPGRFFLSSCFGLLLANFGVLMASMFSQDSIQCPLMKQPQYLLTKAMG